MTKREKKQEALGRARQWHDNRKRGYADRASNNNAASTESREVVNLSSLSSPVRSNGGRTSREVAPARTPTPKKMSWNEKQAARGRARQWHENRRGNNNSADSSTDEEVVNLSSPSSNSPLVRTINHQHGRPSNNSASAAVGRGAQQRRSAPFGMGESQPRRESHQPRSHAATSFAAAGRVRESQREETQQWACRHCTLLNNQNRSRCDACHHANPSAQQSNHGRNAGGRVYDVDRDGNFVTESERNDQRGVQRPSNNRAFGSAARTTAGASRAYRQGIAGSGAMPSAMSGAAAGGLVASGMMSHVSRDDGWGRPSRAFNPASFGGGHNHPHSTGYRLSQLLQSMPRHSNAFRQLQGAGENVDDMSYERLLEVFGNGSENRGASSGDIASLPVSKIGDPERELPEDKRECSICLEEFCRGEERTSLPCLHGFHTACVNRWLSSNGTCPVCKTSVSGG
eukprot:CAMPEP_0172324734 /NCGR_PEP_ID=MMETSP1058-20130122/52136_1 /TAXON_ID=83371 /ORGANISM="Detonula confervacea, Strain CCMP 353" /LENGTH=456 /DNA_ID=CAMNT_0013041093 /DNA_START=41 /DNA_END=1411 /DNA_ORIENTATION=+